MHHWQTPICAILSLYLLIKIYISLPTYCLHQRRCWFMLDCAILTGWDDLFKSMLEGIIIFSWKAIRWSFIWNSVEAMLTIYSSLASASAAATPLRSDIWDKMSFSESSEQKMLISVSVISVIKKCHPRNEPSHAEDHFPKKLLDRLPW